ncbi:FecR domain-containing protein [Methylosinus sp. Sm6]|uniref:FecR domain-containing protein n=1 Tax=Methylosinus sp. Sm6 TaxID=2866948 RepID=UPI001C99136D|nr:FecR domain-containing protein [Methylosinus sp. Sm6]MBY6240121.1 outer membrane beta-barrel protein [Methylosinus sp. Sm6]
MLFLCLALASPALAATKIGGATSIEKDVRGDTGAGAQKLGVGDAVYADEVLTTAAASRGKFVFDDRTDLQMAPSSRVKLDSFVYSGNKGVVFDAAKGAFRFVSAPAGHKDYNVRTPTATIGVRGTGFAVRVIGGRTDALLYSGVIEVCSRATGQCRTLDAACTFVTVSRSGVTQPKGVGKNDWTFDSTCRVPGRRGDNSPPAGAPPMGPGGPSGDEPPAPPSFGFGGPSFGFTVGSAIGDGEFADPVPMNGAGFLGGLRLGYDFQPTPDILVGFETDAQYRSDLGGGSNGHGTISGVRGGYLGTFRGRLGYVFERWLVYGTGGLAYGHILAPRSFSGAGVINSFPTYGTSQSHEFVPGWTIGGGVQFALAPGLSLRAEYLYIRLQHTNPTYMTTASPIPAEVCTKTAMHGLRVGVDFGFSALDLLTRPAH